MHIGNMNDSKAQKEHERENKEQEMKEAKHLAGVGAADKKLDGPNRPST